MKDGSAFLKAVQSMSGEDKSGEENLSYYQKAQKLIKRSELGIKNDRLRRDAVIGYINAMFDYLISIVEDTPGWSDEDKRKDIEDIKIHISDGHYNLSRVLTIASVYLKRAVPDGVVRKISIALEIYKVLSNYKDRTEINDYWVSAVQEAAEAAKNLRGDLPE